MFLLEHPWVHFVLLFSLSLTGAIFAKKTGRNVLLWSILIPILGLSGIFFVCFLAKQKKKPAVEEKDKVPSPSTDSLAWYYLDEQNLQRGPFSLGGLKSLWGQGSIHAKSYIWNETYPNWKKASEVEEILDRSEEKPA